MFFRRVGLKCHQLYERYIERDPERLAFYEWVRIKGDDTLLIRYPLDENSVVVDVGGYIGEWTQSMVERYHPHCYVFEPVQEYYSALVQRFSANAKVRPINCGLSNRNEDVEFFMQGAGSGVYRHDSPGHAVKLQLRDIAEVFSELGIHGADLVSINIEGAEYELFERIFASGLITRWRNVQVQFHNYVPGAREKREAIQQRLALTHTKTYDYPFVWESWRLNSDGGRDA